MSRSTVRQEISFRSGLVATLVVILGLALSARAQSANEPEDKHLDIRSSVGDLHVGSDADARAIGLPLYPGARLKQDDKNKNSANLAILTEAFGMKLLVASYNSNDSSDKLISYYRDKLKKYGKVLECHTTKHSGDINVNADKDDSDKNDPKDSHELKCEGDNTGNVVELKVGTQENQHLVSIEPAEKGAGSAFALVYVRLRGKQGDI
jgi:hypothetical protein